MDPGARTWDAWKTLYWAVVKKMDIKAKAMGGKDIFGASNKATEEDMNPPHGT